MFHGGQTEDSAQRKRIAYGVGRARYRHNARGGIIGDDAGFLKLIYRADDMQPIGAPMIGEQAIELINIGLLPIQANANVQAFIDACFSFPSLAELYKYATYDAVERRQQGRVQGRTSISARGELLAISDDQVRQLYFQNPPFGFYLVQLITRRLLENSARLEALPAGSPAVERPRLKMAA